MDKIIKLLRKITKKERQRIRSLMVLIETRQWEGIDVAKIKGTTNYYRAKRGRFRIIFYITEHDKVIIEDVRVRQEDTYKDF